MQSQLTSPPRGAQLCCTKQHICKHGFQFYKFAYNLQALDEETIYKCTPEQGTNILLNGSKLHLN